MITFVERPSKHICKGQYDNKLEKDSKKQVGYLSSQYLAFKVRR